MIWRRVGMFLGAYRFDGDRSQLLDAYERLMSSYPPDRLDLHVCVVTEHGITVYDACPSRAVFTQFSRSPEFAAAISGAGLPAPTVVPVGEVHTARVRESAVR